MIGSRVTLAIEPGMLARLAEGRQLVLVSGTNGKTTTARLLASAMGTRGPVAHNDGGSNLPGGLLSALAAAPEATMGVLEVDEGWLPRVFGELRPEVVVLLNLSRDQLDRVSEVRQVARRWREMLEGRSDVAVVANCDDPIVAWAAMGAEDVCWVAAGQPWRSDATGCPRCEGRIRYEEGSWHCGGGCGLVRPEPAAWLEGGELVVGQERFAVRLRLPGEFNRANAAVAAMAARRVGVEPEVALAAMSAVAEVAGRYALFDVAGGAEPTEARLLMAKNPAGWVEMFDLVAPAPAPVVVAINARVADGKDPSWLWDVPFERLAGRFVVAGGERWRDLAVRLHYAGVEHVGISSLPEAVLEAARRARETTGGGGMKPLRVEVVANYTAFQDLRRALSRPRRGQVRRRIPDAAARPSSSAAAVGSAGWAREASR